MIDTRTPSQIATNALRRAQHEISRAEAVRDVALFTAILADEGIDGGSHVLIETNASTFHAVRAITPTGTPVRIMNDRNFPLSEHSRAILDELSTARNEFEQANLIPVSSLYRWIATI